MRAAALQIGTVIYIGGQIRHDDGTNSWNVADRKWNEGFFSEVGDSADFYVIHNYYGNNLSSLKLQVDNAQSVLNQNISFIHQDILNKQTSTKPIALTEWNCLGPDTAKKSITSGMQAIVLFCEMMKNNFGMSCRWPLANWEADGMFYKGNNLAIPLWTPRPDFFYIYYLQKFFGDHFVSSSVTGSSDVLAYASKFTSGHAGIVVINKGTSDQIVSLLPRNYGYGDMYYVYSLTGGSAIDFAEKVYVNDSGPTIAVGGPIDNLLLIPAWAYSIGSDLKFSSPARSVQYVLIEPGPNTGVSNDNISGRIFEFKLDQNYPNPFNPRTMISYSLPQICNVTLKVYDLMGREVAALIQNERKAPGNYEISFDASNLSSGVYFYKLQTERFIKTKQMVLVK
jgi:hypothetical protein